LEMGGWPAGLRRKQKAYCQYVEEAVREGVEENPGSSSRGS